MFTFQWLVCWILDLAVWVQVLAGVIVFLGETLSFHSSSLHQGVQMGTWQIRLWGYPVMGYNPIHKPEISSTMAMGHLRLEHTQTLL